LPENWLRQISSIVLLFTVDVFWEVGERLAALIGLDIEPARAICAVQHISMASKTSSDLPVPMTMQVITWLYGEKKALY